MAASATTNTKQTQQQQQQQQRTKQLTTLTVLMLTLLTVLIHMPTHSTAASIFDVKKISSSAATLTVLNTNNDALSNSMPSVLQQLAESGDSGHRVRRKRLRKRHNANMRLSELAADVNDVSATPPEWVNACGGQEIVPHKARAMRGGRSKHVRKQLNLLTKSLRYENSTLTSLHKIIIDDMDAWRLYRKKYRFLPSLTRTAKIELRHWHRDMQKFVASFAELGVKQYRWDQEKRQHTSELTRELNSLLLSAKRVLCEVENAFNATHPQAKLPTITRKEMQKKLKFYSNDEKSVAERGVNSIDLKYAKQRYSKYMQNMFHALRRRLRRSKNVVKVAAKSMANSASIESSSQWAALAQLLNESESEAVESDSYAQLANGASNELLDAVKA